jgi:hypothetical protein
MLEEPLAKAILPWLDVALRGHKYAREYAAEALRLFFDRFAQSSELEVEEPAR